VRLCRTDPCGIRTQPNQLERLATSPEVERAKSVCAQSPLSGTARYDCGCGLEGARYSTTALGLFPPYRSAASVASPGLQPGAKPSQLPAPAVVVIAPEAAEFSVCLRQNEKARCPLRDTGLFEACGRLMADVTCAGDTGILRYANLYSRYSDHLGSESAKTDWLSGARPEESSICRESNMIRKTCQCGL
jgi:hypothetical protein